MSKKCPYCLSEVVDENQVFLLNKLNNWVSANGGWVIFESDSVTYGYPVGKTFTIGVNYASVVAKKIEYSTGDIEKGYYAGDLPQGTEFEVFIVIKVADSYFRKTGTGDSYGEISWDGTLLPVVPKTKTIEVYTFDE